MSATVRAFYGALVGALIVLLVHPYSRPYLLQGAWSLGDSKFIRKTSMLSENIDTLPQPSSLEEAGLWVVTACQREMTSRSLSKDEALLVIEVVQATAEADPDNAFWRQAEAVFQNELGNEDAAIEAWETASVASRWNDYQNLRLNHVLDGLAGESGRNLGWHYAFVDSRKTAVAAQSILSFARHVLRGERVTDFELRLATLRNGRLLRDGSRTVEGAEMGVELIELAAYCTLKERRGFVGSGGPLTPRLLATARDDLISVVRTKQPGVEVEVRDAFLENDAREALINPADAESQRGRLVLLAVLLSALPGALVTIGVIGAFTFLIGWAVGRSKVLQRGLTPPWTLILGFASGIVEFISSGLIFPALWAAVSLGSFGIRRTDERQAAPGGLGTPYWLTISILAVGFSLVLAVLFVSLSAPGGYLMEDAELLAAPLLNESALASLATVIASLALVTASVWGFLARIPPERLAGLSLAKFGSAVCLGCFAFGVALTPIAIGVDRSVGDALLKIFQNEPTFHLTQ